MYRQQIEKDSASRSLRRFLALSSRSPDRCPNANLRWESTYSGQMTPNHRSLMLLSNGCEYGLRAALYLASLEDNSLEEENYVSIRQISEALDISPSFLTKVLQQLTKAGLMQSLRGPKGGVAMARPAGEILIKDLVVAIDGPALFRECVLGLPGCGEEKPCPLHDSWASERGRLERLFERMSLADLAGRMNTFDLRLRAEGAAA